MVWFQCEDCGENLKKPKLLNHFKICSAYKVSGEESSDLDVPSMRHVRGALAICIGFL